VKRSDLSSKTRSLYQWITVAAASVLVAALAGCGGSSGGGSAAPATTPVTPTATTPTVPVPPGTPLDATTLTAAQFAALKPTVPAVSVTINSPPKVSFSLVDAASGRPLTGIGNTYQSATATVPSRRNLAFSLAKLIPEQTAVVQGRTLTVPSKWLSYIVTSLPTFKSATDHTIVPAAPSGPSTDSSGTLVDNGNGTYTYTFFRDITKVKDDIAAMPAVTAPKDKADLGDLTYDPNLVHRLSIQISGSAPGTGNNTPTGSTGAVAGVPIANPLNVIYDFIPATGQQVTASGREIAATQKCNDCHQSLGGFPEATAANSDATFHGGGRNEVRYCVMCHNDQLKYGHADATTTADANGNYTSGDTANINGLSIGALSSHVHKIHMSEGLTKTGYNVGIVYETACRFPQDVRNCTKCHDGSATSTAKTAQGNNWMNVPNRTACGACHDGINFNTGGGITLAEFDAGTAGTGHAGGVQLDDAACGFCHSPATIDVNHIPVTPPNTTNGLFVTGADTHSNAAFIASNTSRLPAGAKKVSYAIDSVSRNSSKNPVMVFKMLQDGAAVPFNTFTKAGAVATATELASQEIWPNYMGAPSVYFVFAMPQDGITAPSDFNASVSIYLRTIWNGSGTGTKTSTLVGPDANGFYTVTFTGVQIPDNAVMLTGGLGYSYDVKSSLPLTQTNVPSYPTAASTAGGLDATMPNKTGGLIVVAPDQQKVGTGYTGRRTIVEDARCNKCHQELGPFTKDAFHAGQRNDGTTCSWCHNPNQNNGGWSGDSAYFVHAIHAAAKRTNNFTWHATSATDGFWQIGYPGILSNCETCHTPTGFDFSTADGIAALPNRLFRTVGSGTTAAATFTTSPYIAQTAGTVYGSGFSFSANNTATGTTTPAVGTTLVNSPITAVCFACHDGLGTTGIDATVHMKSNGGNLYAARSSLYAAGTTNLVNSEQCILCHGANSAFGLGIKAVHAR
jgi:OmcA/MtrC family decaheme c-type cytochrome